MKKKIFYGISAIGILGVVAFAYYAISPLFITLELNEPAPVSTDMRPSSENLGPANQKDSSGSAAMKTDGSDSGDMAETVEQAPSFSIIDTPAHPASGTVRILQTDGKTFVRYENYKTINGPDIYVYLAKDLEAKNFVSLGRVRATEGNVNYEVPAEVDVSEYRYVLTWCKAFGVLFNYAGISV